MYWTVPTTQPHAFLTYVKIVTKQTKYSPVTCLLQYTVLWPENVNVQSAEQQHLRCMGGSALAPESPEIVRQVRGESDPGTTFHRVGIELQTKVPRDYTKFYNPGESPFQGHWGLLLVEATIKTLC